MEIKKKDIRALAKEELRDFFVNNGDTAAALLRIVEVIGQDELIDIDGDTIYFIISTLNQLDIDLLRNKQFIFVKNFKDDIVLKDDFREIVSEHFKLLLPFHDYFSDILTTDLNGRSIL